MGEARKSLRALYLYARSLAKTSEERARLRELALQAFTDVAETIKDYRRKVASPFPDPLLSSLHDAFLEMKVKLEKEKEMVLGREEKACPLCELVKTEDWIEKEFCKDIKDEEMKKRAVEEIVRAITNYSTKLAEGKADEKAFHAELEAIGKKYGIDLEKMVQLP